MDKFGAPVELNYRGLTSYKTVGGAMVTLVFYTLITVHLCIQLTSVATYADPQIVTYEIKES